MIHLPVHIAVFSALTILSQLGGIAYLVALVVPLGRTAWLYRCGTFFAVYVVLSLGAVYVAPQFGRVALSCLSGNETKVVLQSPVYCALNRHYVRPDLKVIANELAAHMASKFPGTRTLALDASFPFIDGFPMVPHLSHDDGRKLDLAFYYRDVRGSYVPGRTRSPIGYWAFEEPDPGSVPACRNQNLVLTMRWNMRWFTIFHAPYTVDNARSAAALRWLATQGAAKGVSKVFIEPHLKQRWNVAGRNIRFQGCRAARHDDHIHFQIGK